MSTERAAVVGRGRRPRVVPEDEIALARALMAGDPGAGAILWGRYERYVYQVVMNVVGSRGGVEDLAHDVFVRLLTHIHELRRPEALRGYVAAVASHTARAELERRTRARRLFIVPESGELPEASRSSPATVEHRCLGRAVTRVLRRMPPRERGALVFRHVEGMTIEETARALRVSTATTKRALRRAIERFARAR